ncbi:Uncharacterised protein r2_g396 [Pycnogonum litorale]
MADETMEVSRSFTTVSEEYLVNQDLLLARPIRPVGRCRKTKQAKYHRCFNPSFSPTVIRPTVSKLCKLDVHDPSQPTSHIGPISAGARQIGSICRCGLESGILTVFADVMPTSGRCMLKSGKLK